MKLLLLMDAMRVDSELHWAVWLRWQIGLRGVGLRG